MLEIFESPNIYLVLIIISLLYYYNRKYINNLFKKNIVNPPKITPRSINQRFIDIDSDIKNLNNELNQYILRSMENDLPLYKSYIDSKNYTQINNDYKIDKNIYWTLVESNDSSMIFVLQPRFSA